MTLIDQARETPSFLWIGNREEGLAAMIAIVAQIGWCWLWIVWEEDGCDPSKGVRKLLTSSQVPSTIGEDSINHGGGGVVRWINWLRNTVDGSGMITGEGGNPLSSSAREIGLSEWRKLYGKNSLVISSALSPYASASLHSDLEPSKSFI